MPKPVIRNAAKRPVWQGPEVDGITFSLLSKFLVCRERFRIQTIEGLKQADGWNHRIFYGQMWHICEESHAEEVAVGARASNKWQGRLKIYCQGLFDQYKLAADQINHWYNICRTQFPHYMDFWSKHPDVKDRTPIFQEKVFKVPYKLPSGRTVYLRGKWDSVDLIGKGKNVGIFLQENKSKGDIDKQQIQRQLHFELQTLIYTVALEEYTRENGPLSKESDGVPICGVRFNAVRRPLSGGKFTIRKHQATAKKPEETDEEFYGRLDGIIREECKASIKEKRDNWFFMRWKINLTAGDVAKFKQRCLNPILEQLCDWYEYLASQNFQDPWMENNHQHFIMPFGCYSALLDGGATELDEHLETGSTLGLQRVTNLFPELQDA